MSDTKQLGLTESPPSDFASASRIVLSYLRERLGFDLWMLTRTEGNDWIILQSEDHGYGVTPGMVFRWSDSFCSEMVKGNGPQIAPDSKSVPAYAVAPIASQVNIGAYIGVPITYADGSLFGTLCAIHPHALDNALVSEQGLLELQGMLLSKILQLELKLSAEARRAERLQAEALSDPLTGLYNRRGWDQLLAREEDRCQRYGHPAAVLVIDLDGLKQINDTYGHAAGDEAIIKAANALRSVARANDVVARLGGDELALMGVECDEEGVNIIATRIERAFQDVGLQASIGLSMRNPAHGLSGAWQAADDRMYQNKRSHRATKEHAKPR